MDGQMDKVIPIWNFAYWHYKNECIFLQNFICSFWITKKLTFLFINWVNWPRPINQYLLFLWLELICIRPWNINKCDRYKSIKNFRRRNASPVTLTFEILYSQNFFARISFSLFLWKTLIWRYDLGKRSWHTLRSLTTILWRIIQRLYFSIYGLNTKLTTCALWH